MEKKEKVELIVNISDLLEKVYDIHSIAPTNEMVVCETIDCVLYKGKNISVSTEELLYYSDEDGSILIKDYEDVEDKLKYSTVEVNENKKSFLDLEDEDTLYLNEVLKKLKIELDEGLVDTDHNSRK